MADPGPRAILITGASSGLGRALALGYAAPGATLHLSGRDADRLAEVAKAARAKGAEVRAEVVDVVNRAAMEGWIDLIEAATPLDLVIANAGVSAGPGGGAFEDPEQTRILFETNVMGVLNTVLPALPGMVGRGRGQIAVVSSMAGFRGLPSAPGYSASKGAVRLWGEALRPHLDGTGVKVSVVCPGFFESRITATNAFPMPMFMTAERAAAHVIEGLAKDKPRIAFPWPMYQASLIPALIPLRLSDWLVRRLPDKG